MCSAYRGQKTAANSLELEIQMVVSHSVAAGGNWILDPLEEEPVLLTAEHLYSPVSMYPCIKLSQSLDFRTKLGLYYRP